MTYGDQNLSARDRERAFLNLYPALHRLSADCETLERIFADDFRRPSHLLTEEERNAFDQATSHLIKSLASPELQSLGHLRFLSELHQTAEGIRNANSWWDMLSDHATNLFLAERALTDFISAAAAKAFGTCGGYLFLRSVESITDANGQLPAGGLTSILPPALLDGDDEEGRITLYELDLNEKSLTLTVAGSEPLRLCNRHFRLLQALVAANGAPVTRASLMVALEIDAIDEEHLKIQKYRLAKALRSRFPQIADAIRAESGGYRLIL